MQSFYTLIFGLEADFQQQHSQCLMTIARSQKQESKFRFLPNTKNCDGTEGARVAEGTDDVPRHHKAVRDQRPS